VTASGGARARRSAGGAPKPAPAATAAAAVLIDTGVLVALFDRLDPHHDAASAWMAHNDAALLTVAPVLSEAALFLPPHLRIALARLAACGVLQLHHPDADGYARIAQLFEKYADQDPDWADLELVWLAESTGVTRIATLDVADFSVYRVQGRRRFELDLLK
jgi:predicted nucleic acid-binding protein